MLAMSSSILCLNTVSYRAFNPSNESLCSARASDGLSLRKAKSSFPNVAGKKVSLVARKKVKCWNYQGDVGEPTPTDLAAWASLKEAIQFQAKEETRLFFRGPAAGDLAEIEAFCRLFRLAEQLQTTVMDALRARSDFEIVEKGPFLGDVPLVEEKVASGIAHLMALLYEGKSDVLGRRAISVEEASVDDLPPFARLRKEVRASCKTLEAALDSILPVGSEQGSATRTRMVKLKNACLDAGFRRPEGIPSHVDIPNLAPVRLRPSKSARTLYKNENVAFWRGGHITEVGMEWLVEKGFRTIVDLREGSAQPIAQCDVPEAVASGKLQVVRIPIERGVAPSDEQVEEFARLVADSGNKPLYLHTRAGVGRASAMVSRWREVVLREQLQLQMLASAEKKDSEPGILAKELEQLVVADDVSISREDALDLEMAIQKSDNGSLVENLGSSVEDLSSASGVRDLEDVADPVDSSLPSTSEDEVPTSADVVEDEQLVPANANGSVKHHGSRFDITKNAFEAQRPVNVLSRKAMSKFLKRRKFPPAYFDGKVDRATGNVSSASSPSAGSLLNGNIAGPANRWGLANPGKPRVEVSKESRPLVQKAGQEQNVDDKFANGIYDGAKAKKNGNSRSDTVNGGVQSFKEDVGRSKEQVNEGVDSNSSSSSAVAGKSFVAVPEKQPVKDDEEDDSSSVEGDMCASTTGVVRIQSRKKAEMFLVRTDGYSCTRERVKESTLAFSHPSTQQQMLMWKTKPRTVLLLKKLGSELNEHVQEVASFLHHQEGMNVMVEPEVHDRLARLPGFGFVQTFLAQDASELHERVDFVVCLGGDGVILHASNLFRNAVPPVVSFNLGSLGFLTSHMYKDYKEDLQAVIHGLNDMMTGVYITLRMRLRCELYRNGKPVPGKVFDVLNEVVIDRGSNPYLCKIECYERNRLITKVQADGVIVATPTGSTAYSTAAGGSMVHPNVPCMLFTPICPHSLSFRPVILPDSALLELKVPDDARNNEWVCFDGKRRQQLSRGDSVRISMSEHPLPTVNKNDQTDDWFQSLVRCLNWNDRLEQRPLTSD